LNIGTIFNIINKIKTVFYPDRKSADFSGAIKGEANGQLPISFRSLPIEIFISNFLPTETSFSLNQCICVFALPLPIKFSLKSSGKTCAQL